MTTNAPLSKSAMAREARKRGERFFQAPCVRHGEQPHYASTRACSVCQADRNAPKNSAAAERYRDDTEYREHVRDTGNKARRKRRENPDYREAERAYEREREANRKTVDPAYVRHLRAKAVNGGAVLRMRKGKEARPDTAMPSKETLRECYEFALRAPEGCELDHGCPLRGVHPVTGKDTVCGLHVPYNLEPMTKRSNTIKRHFFDPENPLEFQKPYNSFPGGQFHGDHAEDEFMRYTTPTTLHIMTMAEFKEAIVEGGNADMHEFLLRLADDAPEL
ncbi:hypothetical protein AWB73_05294 [Caballeronia turbans]|nr:hypothetical protein AWB73_05294 [Caballeronia turbans]